MTRSIGWSLVAILSLTTALFSNDTFILDSFDEAKVLAQETSKPVLIVFGADYCAYCLKLKQDLLLSKDIEHIVCYVDIQDHTDLKDKYNVGVIPDSRVIINNKEVGSFKGYSPQKYFTWLNNAK